MSTKRVAVEDMRKASGLTICSATSRAVGIRRDAKIKKYIHGVLKNRNLGDFSCFFDPKFKKNEPIRANFMLETDCAHSRSLKTLP